MHESYAKVARSSEKFRKGRTGTFREYLLDQSLDVCAAVGRAHRVQRKLLIVRLPHPRGPVLGPEVHQPERASLRGRRDRVRQKSVATGGGALLHALGQANGVTLRDV